MIHMITGDIQTVNIDSVTVGIGQVSLVLFVPTPVDFEVGQETKIFIYLHWNQEQGPTLYGFENQIEKELFSLILSCSGIGPKIALAIIGKLGVNSFVEAVQTNNAQQLCGVQGIGLKKAEQIIVQLKHKISSLLKSGMIMQSSRVAHWQTIEQALQALHYSRNEINGALDYLKTKNEEHSFDKLMRYALSFLSKQP